MTTVAQLKKFLDTLPQDMPVKILAEEVIPNGTKIIWADLNIDPNGDEYYDDNKNDVNEYGLWLGTK